MCTLVVAHRVVTDAPVVVLANRDEFLARPSLPPGVRGRNPRVYCGLDSRQGGTWFGINEHGLVVGLTNLTLRAPDPDLRSRGLLCMDMLACRDAKQVHDALSELKPEAYNPFKLVALDGTNAVRASYDRAVRVEMLRPGVYATTNWPVDSEPDAKRVGVENRVRTLVDGDPTIAELLHGIESEGRRHDGQGDPRESVCCHTSGYGTRASTIVLLDGGKSRVHVQHADGPPCTSSYIDGSREVAAMLNFNEF